MMLAMPAGSAADQIHVLIATRDIARAKRFAVDFQQSFYQRTTSNELEVLNRYWRGQLSRVNELDGTVQGARAHLALTYAEDFGAWFNAFRADVLPLIIQFDLPRL